MDRAKDALEVDVVVVGLGAAGAAAAIAAHDAGAQVAVFEKMPDPGGLSIVSAGGIRIAFDADAAFDYLKATCGGRTPHDLLRVLADGMTQVSDWVRALADVSRATVKVTPARGNYPLPGSEALGYCEVAEVPAIEGAASFHAVRGIRPGCRLFKVLEDNLRARHIAVRLGHPVRRLIREGSTVSGVVVEADGQERRVRARRGVILACGGFEANSEMKRNFFQADPVIPASFLGNTGDGIAMAQEVGAALWHMWHYHGPYGFRHPDPSYPYGLYLKAIPMWHPGHPESTSDLGVVDQQGRPAGGKQLPRLAWILLDKTGRRFMDEYPPYPGDFGVRPLDLYDSKAQDFPRIPAHIVFDENGRRMYPLGRCAINGRDGWYEWSADNYREIELGFFRRFDSWDALAQGIGVDPGILKEEIATWNRACAAGDDEAFGRRSDTMVPLDTPPFYVGQVWPLVINTQGGPVHNVRQEVLNPFGEAIPGLYAAGELGSVFGHLYLSGGNLAECMIGGRIAGREAAKREPIRA
ncbi:FAD-dependent oxidoreductase [Bradyrhizobium lablabi]|uniref:FAD-dependent oxidoreductase n=1 Tax=Bradyrhizobium lablabi TaxID=722472 RepID=UPI001BA735A4|nr:FAD-dependent oxidoreductase [Bradyrhizobium lablabi]MBR1124860.1 FAD-dependent oxidoreductase [Bradyrhizobium lablabi]